MTEIHISNVASKMYGLSVTGHAGYAEIGKDIVCSAISVLSYSLLKYLHEAENENRVGILEETIEEGNVTVVIEINDPTVMEGIKAVTGGYELLSDNYPDYIRIY